jgi:hypothetical protein
MALETDILIISGSDKETAPEGLNIFLSLLDVMLKKVTGISPSFRFIGGTNPMEIAGQIKETDIVFSLVYPALIEAGNFMLTFSAIMDKTLSRAADGSENGLVILFTDQKSPQGNLKAIPEFLPGIRLKYDLGLIHSLAKEKSGNKDVYDCLLDLAYGIRLHKEKKQIKKEEKGRPAIYLAETTPDALHYQQALKNELETLGFRILSPGALNQNEAKLSSTIKDLLSKSFLSLHLVGRSYGQEVADSGKSLVEFQIQIAAEFTSENTQDEYSASLKRMIWIMPPGKNNESKQDKVIAYIKQESRLFQNSELLETPFESLKTYVHKFLSEYIIDSKSATENKNEKSNVFVIFEKAVSENIKPLLDWLDQQKLSYFHPIFNAGPEETMPYYRKMLASCESVLVYYTGENQVWLKTKVNDILKAPGYGRHEPFQSRILFTPENLHENALEQFNILKFKQPVLSKDVLDSLKSFLQHA